MLEVRWQIYAAAKKWEAALDIAAALIRLNPEDPLGWVHRPFALHELKRPAEARDNLLRLVDRFRCRTLDLGLSVVRPGTTGNAPEQRNPRRPANKVGYCPPGKLMQRRARLRLWFRWVCSVAERRKATPAQIALAWLLAQEPWIVPIPGTTKLHRLDENIGAVGIELTRDELREIDSAASKINVQGARYPEKLEQMTGR